MVEVDEGARHGAGGTSGGIPAGPAGFCRRTHPSGAVDSAAPLGRLFVLTDYVFQQRHGHGALAALACAGGADLVGVRQNEVAARHLLPGVQAAVEACRLGAARCVVNERLDLALAAGADGVHLGPGDLPVGVARRLLGDAALVGVSVGEADEARAAEGEGASYVSFGPVFPTASKRGAPSAKGLGALAAACRATALPVFAVAGLTPARVRLCLEVGAHGVVVMTAVTAAPDVAAAARAFRVEIDRHVADEAAWVLS